jgi:hypothetical protein
MRWKAKNPRGSHEYYIEPLTAQHIIDGVAQMVTDIGHFIWFAFRHFTSKKFRLETARTYNQALFGNIPTSQMYVMEGGKMRQLREEERTWPE